mmetsp:Transcript_14748/g.51704  ORF Transcript_14748/g.51704 Transcript_14748/m.51704 type:complete len:99 (-) Transcript_14748:2016-2312(-)
MVAKTSDNSSHPSEQLAALAARSQRCEIVSASLEPEVLEARGDGQTRRCKVDRRVQSDKVQTMAIAPLCENLLVSGVNQIAILRQQHEANIADQLQEL